MRALLLPLVLASCTHDLTAFDRVSVRPARDLDILYVFGDSPNRGSYDQMASQLDVLQAQLQSVDGQLPSLHVGVVTTDLGSRGSKDPLARPPLGNCANDGKAAGFVTFGAGVSGSFLEDLRGPDGMRERNFDSGDLKSELAKLTNPAAGTANTGCEFGQPMEAMRRALDPRVNPGFSREGAILSVVFLTNEDDCSFARGGIIDSSDPALGPLGAYRCTMQGVVCDPDDPLRPGVRTNCRPREGAQFTTDVSEYTAFLQQLKSDPGDVIVSAVSGARNPFEVANVAGPALLPSCSGAGGAAKPAVRLGALVDSFGGALVDACTQKDAYLQIAAPIVNQQRSCFASLRKDDGDDCTVTETIGGAKTDIAQCVGDTASPAPCWYLYNDAVGCPGGDHVGIGIRRGNTTVPAHPRIEATCNAN